jgi:hypothetical protein
MTPEELVKPRYRVVADYPGSPFSWGEVHEPDFMFTEDYDLKTVEDIDKYPHLFKPMQWYEERIAEEFPLFLKTKAGNSVRKVYRVDPFTETVVFDGGATRKLKFWLPATREEYEQFLREGERKGGYWVCGMDNREWTRLYSRQ